MGRRQTALPSARIRKPEPYPSLSSRAAWTKGEDGEAGPRAPHVSKATCGRIHFYVPEKFRPRISGVLNFYGKKAKNREGGPGLNFCQKIYENYIFCNDLQMASPREVWLVHTVVPLFVALE